MFFLVLTTSRCAPGILGTIDRYNPKFSVTVTDDGDEVYTIGTTESDGTTEDTTWEYNDNDFTDTTTNEIPFKSPEAHIDQLAGQDSTTEGQYVNTDKTGCSVTVLDTAGPSPSLAEDTAGE